MNAPAPLKGFTPRAVQSPSAIRAYATCPRMWGYESLEGRRAPDVSFYALPPKPPKPAKGASEIEKAKHKKALKAYNKVMRPAQGTALHAIWETYYRQKVPGAWHPPMVWRTDLAELWHSRPGQIALSGRKHLPDPEALSRVWVEELVSLDLRFLGPGFEGLLIGGTPDLVTEYARRLHLYDYKSTVSIDDYAKTAEELLEDEQSAIYSLAVMQAHGLQSLDCTWVYFQTDETKPARSLPVRFTMHRAHAEAVVARIAQHAQAMADIQARYLAERPGLLGRRLELIKELDTNDMACDNFVGCAFHVKRPGGICKPRKSSLGEKINKQYAEERKTTGRREAAKAAKAADRTIGRSIDMLTPEQSTRLAELEEAKVMAEAAGEKLVFKLGQELLKLKKLAGEGAGSSAAVASAAPAGGTIEATGTEVAAGSSDPAPAKPAAPAKPKVEPNDNGQACVAYAGVSVALPRTSPLHKAIVKICNAQKALDAAVAGE